MIDLDALEAAARAADLVIVTDKPKRLAAGVWAIIRPDGALCGQATVEYGNGVAELPGTYIKVADLPKEFLPPPGASQ